MLTSTTQSLGAKLREQKEERKVRGEASAKYRAEAEVRKQEEERAQIGRWFAEARAEAFEAASKGIAPEGIEVRGYGMPFLFGRIGSRQLNPTNPHHPYHDAYLPFAAWARENEVEFKVTDEHDGVGMESWHRITVVPI
jgi:hypothetical protein